MREIAERGKADARALVYDSKTDLLSMICGMGVPEDRLLVLNPFDARVWAWHMAADIRDPMQADDVANVLIPSSKGDTNPYFPETARRFLAGIIEVFIESAGENWTLRDLILAVKTPERLKLVLSSSSETRRPPATLPAATDIRQCECHPQWSSQEVSQYRRLAPRWKASLHDSRLAPLPTGLGLGQ